ncbi:DUF4175 domain-containing protein [Mucilaginibacter sp. RS28]|uniref:DUF4175 domain-containing protein n=1 Tax=Mucilaginibacter straminoryzae TaxID=2932774 RepID=A0A9X1X6D0_9SPHI|nr:DUF4175 family protein [Mucilaginibacter straminoryzae]MCJ8209479.1 DUF4175 domain-containing protein [Mucilaginibacter straminoryzae]
MANQQGIEKIKQIRQRWVSYQLTADALLCAAIALLAGALLHAASINWVWCILIFAVIFSIVILLRKPWATSLNTVSLYLDQTYPELEESATLALQPAEELNLLQALQQHKVVSTLQHIPGTPAGFTNRLKRAALFLAAALVLSFILLKIPIHSQQGIFGGGNPAKENEKNLPPEKILPQISNTEVTITPPAYTGKKSYQQDRFTLNVEEGASVSWLITTNTAVDHLTLIFNEREKIDMQPAGDHQHWQAQKVLSAAGFYQVELDGKLSDLYAIQIIKDTPPVIHIKAPKQYTHIDAGEKPQVTIQAAINDDYGVGNAYIAATVAKGRGEGVKFKEYKIDFSENFGGHNKQYDLKKLVSLPAFNMEPGDELYFFIQAQDTHKLTSRTDVYIVSIQDTAQLLSMDGIVSGVNLKPEFFRSERQIIIDSQKLLHDRDSISKEEFNRRSNELGTDQKLLRLRYGKFLGEEDESNMDEDKSGGQLGKAENFGNTAMVMDAYTDKHDNAEDATFLEPTAKAQLKATLTEMWRAELHLRMYKPEEALPFEFKALRLLKDLQQKSRSYVAKTGYNPPPLKMEKRLSGELDKIAEPVAKEDIKKTDDQFATLKKAVIILEQYKTTPVLSPADKHTLQLAGQEIGRRASSQPGIYLPALTALKQLTTSNKISTAKVDAIEKALQRMLPVQKQLPSSSANAANPLSQQYFKTLSRLNK